MPIPRYTPQEAVRRGQEWYEREIRQQVEQETNFGKTLVIDIETGEYEMDEDHMAATYRALKKNPDAQLYGMRIGFPALAKMGGGWNLSRT